MQEIFNGVDSENGRGSNKCGHEFIFHLIGGKTIFYAKPYLGGIGKVISLLLSSSLALPHSIFLS